MKPFKEYHIVNQISLLQNNLENIQKIFFGKSGTNSETFGGFRTNRSCRTCGRLHGAWVCGNFKQMDAVKSWECAKQCKFVFVV